MASLTRRPAEVCWVSLASGSAMGQQLADASLKAAIAAEAGPQWRFREVSTTSFQSTLAADVRVPFRLAGLVGRPLGALVTRGADIVHRLDLRIPLQGDREVLTVHDLPPLRFADEGTLPRHAGPSARRARMVVCPSQFAADEVADLLGVHRLAVVPNGVDPAFQHGPDATPLELAALGIRSPFVLHAGGTSRRKNLAGLAQAWTLTRLRMRGLQLVLCGPASPDRDALFAGLPDVVMPGRLPPARLARVMRVAACVVVPSTYEGFGLPVLEAQSSGRPLVAADRGALREVSGGHCLLVEPAPEAIAGAIVKAVERGPEVEQLILAATGHAATFTWERAARGYLDVYREALVA